jgi:predicted transcriptional regulator
MEIHFTIELEAKLNRIAADTGRPAEQIVKDLVRTYVDHDQWFRQEVQKGIAQPNQGQSMEHEDVIARIEQLFHS